MGIGPHGVRGELDPVTAELAGSLDGSPHEVVADAAPPMVRVDMDRLDLGTEASAMLEVTEHDQLAHPNRLTPQVGHQQRAGARVDIVQGGRIRSQVGCHRRAGLDGAQRQQGHQASDIVGPGGANGQPVRRHAVTARSVSPPWRATHSTGRRARSGKVPIMATHVVRGCSSSAAA
jgi:hypothetical protein